MRAKHDSVQAQYLRFCANPLRDAATVATEFDLLCAVPGIERIAFLNEHTLVLGTRHIVIYDPETRTHRDVGEFLIFIRRYYENPTWDVAFRFQNITRDLYGNSGYMHPHIVYSDYDKIPTPTGGLCIQRGRYHIFQHIRRGEIYLVAPLLLEILDTYNMHGPYHELYNWPVYGRDVAEDAS